MGLTERPWLKNEEPELTDRQLEDPCKNCYDRQWYSRRMDIHFWGEDCPYGCEEYEKYKKEKQLEEINKDEQEGR